jgi:hypothetical protein
MKILNRFPENFATSIDVVGLYQKQTQGMHQTLRKMLDIEQNYGRFYV